MVLIIKWSGDEKQVFSKKLKDATPVALALRRGRCKFPHNLLCCRPKGMGRLRKGLWRGLTILGSS